MSTNYYAFGPHKGTDDGDAGLHIGKKAVGWRTAPFVSIPRWG